MAKVKAMPHFQVGLISFYISLIGHSHALYTAYAIASNLTVFRPPKRRCLSQPRLAGGVLPRVLHEA